MKKIKVRFAPSPTGDLHIGGVRTALFNYAFAKKNNGEFLLRIEDTDISRSTYDSAKIITQALYQLGLKTPKKIIYQSNNRQRHQKIINEFIKSGKAYRCYCSQEKLKKLKEECQIKKQTYKYDGKCRSLTEKKNTPFVVRFKTPKRGNVKFNDLIKGKITIANDTLDDFIIARTDGTPTYNFCVAVDDIDMQISHVIRGDDHLSNTPKQIHIYKATGATIPQFAHLPMILGEDGKRLSKRHGALNILEYLEDGVLPNAILNYLARLGWSHKDMEFFTPNELFAIFDLKSVNKSAAIFNPQKLLWLNQQHMQKISCEKLAEFLLVFLKDVGIKTSIDDKLLLLIKAFVLRTNTLKKMAKMCYNYYYDFDNYDMDLALKNLNKNALLPLETLKQNLYQEQIWTKENVKKQINKTLVELNIKMPALGMPARTALINSAISPSVDIVIMCIGKQKSIKRLTDAIKYIKKHEA
jgi:glutamyl-tRNA synthetase